MLPISVDPRAKANKTSRHPPSVNSLEFTPVARFFMGVAAAKAVKANVMKVWVYMMKYRRIRSLQNLNMMSE